MIRDAATPGDVGYRQHAPRIWSVASAVLVWAALLGLSTSAAMAGGKQNATDKPDHLAIAALLVRDGHLDRALVELEQVDLEDPEVDQPKLWKLHGVVALQQKRWSDAALAFEKSLAAGATDPLIYVTLAQAHFKNKAWAKSVAALDKTPRAQRDAMPRLWLVEAQARLRLGQTVQAYRILTDVEQRHPEVAREATRIKIYLLMDKGLYRAAAQASKGYLANAAVPANDFLAVAEALRRGRAFDQAIELLELARLRFPAVPDVLVGLARCYADLQHTTVAAGLFERASFLEVDPKRIDAHTLAAAELYRRSGQLRQAILVNGRLRDQKVKIRQRMGLLVELGRFESAAAMASRIQRLGLDRDDSVVYAVAFSFFRTRRFERAERWLKKISSPQMFEKSADLRKVMEGCKTGRIPCE